MCHYHGYYIQCTGYRDLKMIIHWGLYKWVTGALFVNLIRKINKPYWNIIYNCNIKSLERYFFVQLMQNLFRNKKRKHLNESKSCSLKIFSCKILPVESPNVKLTPRPFCFLTSSATEVVTTLQSQRHSLCTSRAAHDVPLNYSNAVFHTLQ